MAYDDLIGEPMTSKRLSQETLIETSAVAGMFSARIIRDLALKGRSLVFSRLVRESRLACSLGRDATLRDAFEEAFARLSRCHRTEYVYKNAVAQKILLGRHNLNTAVMMTELRVGSCKADVVVLNGTSTAYEIKSERDNLDRLAGQVETYLRVFAHVNVIASAHHISDVLATVPRQVGVMRLTPRGSLSTHRNALEDTARISPSILFDMLRSNEARRILQALGVDVPDVPNTRLHSTQRTLFEGLDPTDLHSAMIGVLKVTRSQRSMRNLLDSAPRSLRAAIIASRLGTAHCERLQLALDTPIADALTWT